MKRVLNNRKLLPQKHWRTLMAILNLLAYICSHEADNKMSVKNMSKVFGLTLFRNLLNVSRANTATEFLIRNFDQLFDHELV